MSVIPDHRRAASISTTLGDLLFTPATGTVSYYEARAYAEGTSTPILATKYLGVPEAEVATGKIRVSIRTMLNALPPGNYDVLVAAYSPGGSEESTHGTAYTVPLQP